MGDTFKKAEDQYFVLKGQLATGRFTARGSFNPFGVARRVLLLDEEVRAQWARVGALFIITLRIRQTVSSDVNPRQSDLVTDRLT